MSPIAWFARCQNQLGNTASAPGVATAHYVKLSVSGQDTPRDARLRPGQRSQAFAGAFSFQRRNHYAARSPHCSRGIIDTLSVKSIDALAHDLDPDMPRSVIGSDSLLLTGGWMGTKGRDPQLLPGSRPLVFCFKASKPCSPARSERRNTAPAVSVLRSLARHAGGVITLATIARMPAKLAGLVRGRARRASESMALADAFAASALVRDGCMENPRRISPSRPQ